MMFISDTVKHEGKQFVSLSYRVFYPLHFS